MEWLIGPDGILDPSRWFIVIPNMFSNGVSSGAAEAPDFPALVTARLAQQNDQLMSAHYTLGFPLAPKFSASQY